MGFCKQMTLSENDKLYEQYLEDRIQQLEKEIDMLKKSVQNKKERADEAERRLKDLQKSTSTVLRCGNYL